MMQKEVLRKTKERERDSKGEEQKGMPYQWFHSKENQVTFIRNLRLLNELDYEKPSQSSTGERREVTQDRPRSLTLFVFSGESKIIDDLQSRMQLREHDILERYAKNELHGLLAHLKEMDPFEIEEKFKTLTGTQEFSRLKCLLLFLFSPKKLEGDVLGLINTTLREMKEGEVKTLSIQSHPLNK
jgi:hypothetical protein